MTSRWLHGPITRSTRGPVEAAVAAADDHDGGIAAPREHLGLPRDPFGRDVLVHGEVLCVISVSG
jgi:hypothetical protein